MSSDSKKCGAETLAGPIPRGYAGDRAGRGVSGGEGAMAPALTDVWREAAMRILGRLLCAALIVGPMGARGGEDGSRTVVFVAGGPSHDYGSHEHRAGSLLLAEALAEGMPGVETRVIIDGWPEDSTAFEGADAVVIFSDGGGGHPALPHRDQLAALMDEGVGLVCLHYAVEVPEGAEGGDDFLDWLGGYFELGWSVNPHWTPEFTAMPVHPITRGVGPIELEDEWYYHMRFRPDMEGVTPILSAVPPASTLSRPDGPHSGNPAVRDEVAEGRPQHVAWAFDRPGGGRSFGFTGAHVHWNWGDDAFRTLVLNGIAWAAGLEVPEGGVPSSNPDRAALEANQDEPKPSP